MTAWRRFFRNRAKEGVNIALFLNVQGQRLFTELYVNYCRMSTLDPIWQHNISKKIVAMTKVVFRLHADSIDHKDEVALLRTNYETELSEIESSSRENLARAQQEANDYHPVIERTVRSEFETKFNQTKILFDATHEKLEADSTRAIETATARLNDLKARVEALKLKADQSTEVFEEAKEEIKKLHADAVRRLEEQRLKELSTHVDGAKAKYEAAVAAARKREDDLRKRFELELENLRKTLASSQVNAVETLNKRQEDLETGVGLLQKQKQELITMIDKFRKECEAQKQRADEMMEQAREMQKDLIGFHQKELDDVQAAIDAIHKKYDEELEKLKAEMAQEEEDHQAELEKRRAKLEKEKRKLQKQMAKFEAESKQSALAADERYQKLSDEYNSNLAEIDAQHAAYIDEAKKRDHAAHEALVDMQKQHLEKLVEMRNKMEQDVEESKERMEELRKKYHEEIMALRAEQDEQVEKYQEKLKENSKASASALEQLLKDEAELKEQIEKAKQAHQTELEEIERKNTSEFLILKKHQSEDMSMLERNQDIMIKKMELDHNAEMEKRKKEFILHAKNVQESHDLNLRLDMEAIAHNTKRDRAEELAQKRDVWEKEIAELQDQIETKTQERKQIEAKTQKEVSERQTKISAMKKELEKLEEDWKGEKQQFINDWETKLENLTKQIREEERQNEEARRMSVAQYEDMLNKLKDELAEAENRKTEELKKIKKETEEQKSKKEAEIEVLQKEAERLQSEHVGSVADLEKQLENAEKVSIQKQKDAEADRKSAVSALQDEFRKVRAEGRKKIQQAEDEMFKEKQEQERKLQEKRMELEQYQIDSQFNAGAFQRQKQLEFEQLENQQKHEIELMNIELHRIHNDTDHLKEVHMEEMRKIQELHDRRRMEQKDNFEKQRLKLEDDNNQAIAEKESIIRGLEASIQEWEDNYNNRAARPEDSSHIHRLDELIQERQDGLDKMGVTFQNFERELMTHETVYHKTYSGEPPPMPLNPVADRRMKKERTLKAVSSAKRIPPLVTPLAGTPR